MRPAQSCEPRVTKPASAFVFRCLLDPVARGIFKPKVKDVKIDRHVLTVLPPVLTATLSVVLFFFAGMFLELAEAMVTR